MISKLHVGSTKEPKLPVPIHFADKLAKLAGRDLIPSITFDERLYFI